MDGAGRQGELIRKKREERDKGGKERRTAGASRPYTQPAKE